MPSSLPTTPTRIRPRDRDAILQSLRAGVVPSRGQQHIQVGRSREVEALLQDLERLADGGSALRFVIGEYGSGKTFFLQLVRSLALEKGLVTAHGDLAPDRRLQASDGKARALYATLMAQLATRTKPEGGAVASVVERFVGSVLTAARTEGRAVEEVLRERLDELSEMPGGYDFAEVIHAYWRGHEEDRPELQRDAVRWLRGEFRTRTDARKALGVRTIVDDDQIYDQLKLFARFVRLAGYGGLLVCMDEMVNLYKIGHTRSRENNYEQVLRIVNDSLQGTSVGLGFLFGGTPEFLMDPRRGLYSYEALRSRLADNRFAVDGLEDLSGPVIRLANLTQEELFLLLGRLLHVQAGGDPDRHLLGDDALEAFMRHCFERVGEAYFRTPRNTIRAFLDLLAVLEQNPEASWDDLLPRVTVEAEEPDDGLALPGDDPDREAPAGDDQDGGGDDDLASFRL